MTVPTSFLFSDFMWVSLLAGGLGGLALHMSWLAEVAASGGQSPNVPLQSRLLLAAILMIRGAIIGWMIWWWFSADVLSEHMGAEKVAAIAFIAGMAGSTASALL